jgi:Cdc6-like AAA superfamily ATPase
LSDEEEARAAVMAGQSLLVEGSPGSGKTTFVRSLVDALRASGKVVDIIAKTHAAVQNFAQNAQTADRWVRRVVRSGGCVNCSILVVDEVTMVESILWADIAKVSLMAGIAFILCGDFLQFPAVCEHCAGCAVPEGALERSHMLRDLVDGNRLTLTENKRSDQVLYQLYTSLQRRTLADALEEARARFPVTTRPATTIVISHARRRFLNMKQNLKDKRAAGAIFLKAPMTGGKPGGGASPQSMWLWSGSASSGQDRGP